MPSKRTVVYTAIFGGRDRLTDPQYVNEDFTYICFTDNREVASDLWDIHYCSPTFPDPVICAKMYKILAHNFFQDFEESIWVDGNMVIIEDLSPLLTYVNNNATLACFDHFASAIDPVNCIYDEADKLLKKIGDGKHPTLAPEPIIKQVARLKKDGYPKQNGLISGNLLVRKHMSEKCIDMMEKWWFEILSGSRRDELSFNYLVWKMGFDFNYIPGDFKNSKWFTMLKHVK